MTDYYSLTTRGRARRLRVLAFAALEGYPLQVHDVRLLELGQNGIFRVDATRGSSSVMSERFVMRVARPDNGHPIEHIESEMRYLRTLAEDGAIPAPEPIATRDGRYAVSVAVPGVPEPRNCALIGWVPGVDLADRLDRYRWRQLGSLSARFHEFGRRYTPGPGFVITTNHSPFAFDEECVFFDEPYRSFFSRQELDELSAAIARAQVDIDALHAGPDIIVTHGDLHVWNVRTSRGHLYPIDFEDLLWEHPVQDVAITLSYHRFDASFPTILSDFRAGYEGVAPWPETWSGQLDLHMLARRLNLLNYALYSRETDVGDPRPWIDETMGWVREALQRS